MNYCNNIKKKWQNGVWYCRSRVRALKLIIRLNVWWWWWWKSLASCRSGVWKFCDVSVQQLSSYCLVSIVFLATTLMITKTISICHWCIRTILWQVDVKKHDYTGQPNVVNSLVLAVLRHQMFLVSCLHCTVSGISMA